MRRNWPHCSTRLAGWSALAEGRIVKPQSDSLPILILAAALLAGAASPPPITCVKGSTSADCVAPKKAPAKKHAPAGHSVTYAPEPTVYQPADAVETVATDTPATETIAKPARACAYKNGKRICH